MTTVRPIIVTIALGDHLPSEPEGPGASVVSGTDGVSGEAGVSGTEGLATGAGVGTTGPAVGLELQQVGAM